MRREMSISGVMDILSSLLSVSDYKLPEDRAILIPYSGLFTVLGKQAMNLCFWLQLLLEMELVLQKETKEMKSKAGSSPQAIPHSRRNSRIFPLRPTYSEARLHHWICLRKNGR